MYEVKRQPLNFYESQICAMEQKPIKEGLILFYGDSSFTRWREGWGNVPVEEAIRGKNGEKACVNHAFGGSTAEEQLYYYPRLVRPWKPKALILSSCGNSTTFGYTNQEVLALIFRMLEYARTDFPGIKLFIKDRMPGARMVAHQPHEGHEERLWDLNAWRTPINEINDTLRDYCARHEDTTFIEHSKFPFLFQEGHVGDYAWVREDMYIEDKTHMTREAYNLVAEEYKKFLEDLL